MDTLVQRKKIKQEQTAYKRNEQSLEMRKEERRLCVLRDIFELSFFFSFNNKKKQRFRRKP